MPDPERFALARVVLVVGYLTAALCWRQAALRAKRMPDDPFTRLWMIGAVLLLMLAVNKAFDLRTQAETLIRTIAQTTGWYEQRQSVQFFLAVVLPAIAGLLLGIFLWTKARKFVGHQPMAFSGWLLVFLYLACRQSLEWKPAFHWLTSIGYFSWRLLLEAAGIVLLILASIPARMRPPS